MCKNDFTKKISRYRLMRNLKRVGILFWFVWPLLAMAQDSVPVHSFSFQGRTWNVSERTVARGDVELVIAGAGNETILSAALAGENYWLQSAVSEDDFFVVWLHYQNGIRQMAIYDERTGVSRLLPLQGFRSFPQVEIVMAEGTAGSLFFLGERNGMVDLFHYDLELNTLTQLTASQFCQKEFSLKPESDTFIIRCQTLAETTIITFDTRTRHILSIRSLPLPKRILRKKQAATSYPAAFYNTYVGFGDSITWGQIAQVQHPQECFLNQIKLTLTPNWGEMFFYNMGNPGTQTLYGAQNIEADLEGIEAQYFLLMYGVNDVWNNATFSLASSRENLAVMIDVAKSKGMDVIISTLTPRKDRPQDYLGWQNLHDLSDAILELAIQKNVASIDTLSVFMNTTPPNGWKDLLETPGWVFLDGEWVEIKGNHPNAQGHRLIADLFVNQFERIHAPTVVITEAPVEAYAGDYAHFAAQATPYEDATITRIEWTFAGDSIIEIGDSVNHKMQGDNQNVTVTATAIDSKGRQGTATVTLLVRALYAPTVAWRKIHVRTIIYDRDAGYVTWTPDPRNEACGYKIVAYWVYRVDAQDKGMHIATIDAGAPHWFLDLESPPNVPVYYAVAAVDAAGHVSPLSK